MSFEYGREFLSSTISYSSFIYDGQFDGIVNGCIVNVVYDDMHDFYLITLHKFFTPIIYHQRYTLKLLKVYRVDSIGSISITVKCKYNIG